MSEQPRRGGDALAVTVRLGTLAPDSLAPSVLALVRAGSDRDPQLARDTVGTVLLRFVEGFPSVAIVFAGDDILIADAPDEQAVRPDLEVTGRLPDVLMLVSVPQAGGVPLPTTARGRAALARLADGRVEMDGPIRLGRRLLMLLRVET